MLTYKFYLFLRSTFFEESEQKRICIDFGNGRSRTILHLNSVDMNSDLKSALTGFHAFTGNDYLSCIFRKSKELCWKALLKSNKFVQMFKELVNEWELKEELIPLLEEYICSLFRKNKKKGVNLLLYEIFQNVYEEKGKFLYFLPAVNHWFCSQEGVIRWLKFGGHV